MSGSNVKTILDQKRFLTHHMYELQRAVQEIQVKIKVLETELYNECEHNWIRDEYASFDDRVKTICSICGVYNSPYMYKR